MDIKSLVQQLDMKVSQGDIVNAVKEYFADDASTSDYSNVTTVNKDQMVEKMEGFLNSIAQVNGITHHNTITDGQQSASEFTFDFDMKDNSKVLWHEIIWRTWNNHGEVIREEYFQAGN